jgi:hypothetical protein
MQPIQRVSRYFRLFIQIIFLFLPLMEIAYWITNGHFIPSPIGVGYADGTPPFDLWKSIDFQMIPPNLPELASLKPHVKFLGFLINLIPLFFCMMVLYFLIGLFKLYEQMQIFSEKNVSYIRKIGWTILISQMVNPFYQALMTFTLTFNNPVGQRFVALNFSSGHLTAIFTGLLLILISWIMDEGRKLQEEQKYTV